MGGMISKSEISRIVVEQLDAWQREKYWGELVLKISIKNGDPQQLAVVTERTFRDLQTPPTKT